MNSNKDDNILSGAAINLLATSMDMPPISDSIKNRIKSKVQQRISGECPEGGKTIYNTQADWFALNDKISIKVLHQDKKAKVQTALWRLKPGAIISGHRHAHDEECLVMEGSIRVGNHELKVGDFHLMEKDSYHPELVSENGALLYLRHDMKEYLMGPAG